MLPPSIADTTRRQIGTRNVRGLNAGGTRTEMFMREFAPVVTDEPKHRNGTDTAPTPLETVLAALIGCKGATVFYCAEAMKFQWAGFAANGESVVDQRGPRGVPGVRPYYESVTLKMVLFTDESEERIAKLIKNVEHRCPVANLLKGADVDLDVQWSREPASAAPPEGTDARSLEGVGPW